MTKEEGLRALVASGIMPGQRYIHAKTGRHYEVKLLSLDEKTCTPMVHYQKEGDSPWSRTIEDFTQMVMVNGREMPRFIRVGT